MHNDLFLSSKRLSIGPLRPTQTYLTEDHLYLHWTRPYCPTNICIHRQKCLTTSFAQWILPDEIPLPYHCRDKHWPWEANSVHFLSRFLGIVYYNSKLEMDSIVRNKPSIFYLAWKSILPSATMVNKLIVLVFWKVKYLCDSTGFRLLFPWKYIECAKYFLLGTT